MTSKVLVAGVGMLPFCKPGQQSPYREMASTAIKEAIADAGIESSAIQQAFASYIYGDSTCGQHALYDAFMTGIPIINVNNNCSSGSTAIFMARQAIQSGAIDCALAFGFEEMQPGALGSNWDDRESPLENFMTALDKKEYPDAPLALRSFGAAGHHYLEKYATSADLFGKVAVKTRSHAGRNPHALLVNELTLDEVMSAPLVYMDYLTRLMCCPPTCGAGAAILCSEEFAKDNGIQDAIAILAQAMTTDTSTTWEDPMNLVGVDMTRRAAAQAFNEAEAGPADVDVIELHDCFTVNEVLTYEALGLCAEGEATDFVNRGDNTYGGKFVINPSGGLMSKGHPIGATGLAQCYELVKHLRREAGARQVEDANMALQHNLGLGGAAVVTLYARH